MDLPRIVTVAPRGRSRSRLLAVRSCERIAAAAASGSTIVSSPFLAQLLACMSQLGADAADAEFEERVDSASREEPQPQLRSATTMPAVEGPEFRMCSLRAIRVEAQVMQQMSVPGPAAPVEARRAEPVRVDVGLVDGNGDRCEFREKPRIDFNRQDAPISRDSNRRSSLLFGSRDGFLAISVGIGVDRRSIFQQSRVGKRHFIRRPPPSPGSRDVLPPATAARGNGSGHAHLTRPQLSPLIAASEHPGAPFEAREKNTIEPPSSACRFTVFDPGTIRPARRPSAPGDLYRRAQILDPRIGARADEHRSIVISRSGVPAARPM